MVKSLHQRVVLSAKKKFSKGPTKNDFYPPNAKFLISMRCSRGWCAVGVHVVDETRATTRKKAAKQKRAFLPPFIGIIALCSKRETRERDEKEWNSTLSEIAISLSFSPLLFSLWLLFFGTKKRLKSFEKRVPWRRCGSWIGWKQPRTAWVGWSVVMRRNYFECQLRVFCLSRWLRETRLIFATRVKGLIPTWVANLPATERKKNISARA